MIDPFGPTQLANRQSIPFGLVIPIVQKLDISPTIGWRDWARLFPMQLYRKPRRNAINRILMSLIKFSTIGYSKSTSFLNSYMIIHSLLGHGKGHNEACCPLSSG